MQQLNRRPREPSGLEWRSALVVLACSVCGRVDDQLQLATARVEWQPDEAVVARCGDCGSIVIGAVVSVPEAYLEESWDIYVEQTAGIEAIADTLAQVSTSPGARMLDVGCGFGFGLDLGERLRGWHGIGLDPSPAANAGRAALGLDIRIGLLDEEFAPGEHFDVILASELFEHVPDPRSFLKNVRSHLADDGVLLLATPDAAVINPESPLTKLLPALSIGAHVFLVTADGLRRVLEDAGLVADITTDGSTIHAVASPTPAGLRHAQSDGSPSLAQLAQYCADRAKDAAPGSALAVGMLSRQVKFIAYQDDFHGTAAAMPALREALLARYDIDLDDPTNIIARPFVPAVISSAGYFAGVVAEYVQGDHHKALALFTASALAARHHREEQKGCTSPEVLGFEAKSLGERAIILTSVDPGSVDDALRDLYEAAARGGCDPEVVDDFRRRTETLMNERLARANRAWAVRVKFAVGRRIRRFRR